MFRIPQPFRLSSFQAGDPGLQPLLYGSLQFLLRAIAVKEIDCFSLFSQRNIAAWNFSASHIQRHELHQLALAAWFPRLSGVKVQTGRRILKHQLWAPSRLCGVVIASLPQKIQFCLQHFQKTSRVNGHKRDPSNSFLSAKRAGSPFAMFKKLNLAQTLLRRFQILVRAAQIPAFAGDDLISSFHFFDHGNLPASEKKPFTKCKTLSRGP
jgi:hypothetical protein